MFKHSPVEKALWSQWNIPLTLIAPREKVQFYERFFYEVVIVMVKYIYKKIEYKRYNVIFFISFMHYIKRISKINVTVVIEEFEMVYIFLLLFSFFIIIVNW